LYNEQAKLNSRPHIFTNSFDPSITALALTIDEHFRTSQWQHLQLNHTTTFAAIASAPVTTSTNPLNARAQYAWMFMIKVSTNQSAFASSYAVMSSVDHAWRSCFHDAQLKMVQTSVRCVAQYGFGRNMRAQVHDIAA
jgi:hypothetical protein